MSRWLFFPSPAASGYLQEITWNMSGSATASSISSTGQEIINSGKSDQLAWYPGYPRFWNGAESQNSGADTNNAFSTTAACRVWWNNYIIEMEFNGAAWDSSHDPISGACAPSYLNPGDGNFNTEMTAFVSGDIIKFRVSTAS